MPPNQTSGRTRFCSLESLRRGTTDLASSTWPCLRTWEGDIAAVAPETKVDPPVIAHCHLAAGQAMTSHQDLGDLAHLRELFQRGLRQIQFMQAGDLPASDADEMRMLTAVLVVGITKLKPPDVVAQFGTRDQPCLGQIIQVAKDSRFVEPQRHQINRDLGVRCRCL